MFASNRLIPATLLLLTAALIAQPSQAVGTFFVVDSVLINDANRCSLESWYQRNSPRDRDVHVTMACNPGADPNLDMELWLAMSRAYTGRDRTSYLEPGAKLILRDLMPGDFGFGVASNAVLGDDLPRLQAWNLYAPISLQPEAALIININLGWTLQRHAPNAWTWGLGMDYAWQADVHLLAEVYGTHRGGTRWQSGLRFNVGQGHVDFGYGRNAVGSRDDHWVLGLGWAF